MSWKHLGETFDIHGGGIDLVFPHHENEIAQSRCAFHSRVMANFWLHNGFLQVEGEKMSKSVGNFTIIRDVLADWPGDVVRLSMLSSHYRQPINWTIKGLERPRRRWRASSTPHRPKPSRVRRRRAGGLARRHQHAEGNRRVAWLEERRRPQGVGWHAGILRLPPRRVEGLADRARSRAGIGVEEIERRIAARNDARKVKDFKESDRIRDELAKMGVVLKDSKDGTTWEVAR
jgi:cysteinyl-tRNA synthetase